MMGHGIHMMGHAYRALLVAVLGTAVRGLIRDDPRRGVRVLQVHAAAPCQH